MCAVVYKPVRRLFVIVHRYEDDLQTGSQFANTLCDLNSAQVGKTYVQEHEIRLQFLSFLNGRQSSTRFTNYTEVGLRLEFLANLFSPLLGIIDYKNAGQF